MSGPATSLPSLGELGVIVLEYRKPSGLYSELGPGSYTGSSSIKPPEIINPLVGWRIHVRLDGRLRE